MPQNDRIRLIVVFSFGMRSLQGRYIHGFWRYGVEGHDGRSLEV